MSPVLARTSHLRRDRRSGPPVRVASRAGNTCRHTKLSRRRARLPAFLALIVSFIASPCLAREIHVSTTGNDSAPGTQSAPCRTISQAAAVAQPGDLVIVHEGTYREWVKPPRGGSSETDRIAYRAAPGEEVFIKGSERITSWQKQGGGVWIAEIPNELFADYNPYALKLTGGWLNYGQWHTRGDVYLDGEAFYEKQTAAEVDELPQTWHARVEDGRTVIRANFGATDPNQTLTEINVRESLFMPAITGLKYITVDGFHFAHAASNWAPPTIELQTGAVGTRMGKHWIIQNCTITNARCVGIILGHAPGVDYQDIDAYGDHIVRNNLIRRCGQAGIAGQKGATRSVIAGNLIEDTNYRKEFGGWETAAIKFHNSVDTVIRDNLIRGVYHQIQGAFGIWIDFGNQGLRISRNVIYDTRAATLFLEMNHGPTLVDNNVFVGQPVRSNSEATVFAHNLFVDCGYNYHPDVRRRSQYYQPHTTIPDGRKTGTARETKWFNNVFVRKGLAGVKSAPGYASDYNAFLEGARPSAFGDEHSIADPQEVEFSVASQPQGATIAFSVPGAVRNLRGPLVEPGLVGVFSTVGQTIEDRSGNPVAVDRDISARNFSPPRPGPLADLSEERNRIQWKLDSLRK